LLYHHLHYAKKGFGKDFSKICQGGNNYEKQKNRKEESPEYLNFQMYQIDYLYVKEATLVN